MKKFFLPIEIYEVGNSFSVTAEELNRLTGLRLCKDPKNLALLFSQDTLDKFENIFLFGSRAIPYDNLVQCCYSVSWDHAFLEVYRCIERLYPIPALNALHTGIGLPRTSGLTVLDLGEKVEKELHWRAQEEGSLEKIFNKSPKKYIAHLKSIKNKNPQMSGMNTPKWFYQIRNNIVHFRLANQSVNMDDKERDELVMTTLQLIEHWYKEYESILRHKT